MYFVISIKSISNLVCLSVDPLTIFNSKSMEQRQDNRKVNDQAGNQQVERYAIRDFVDKNANPTLDNDAHENESTVKG